MQTLNDESEKQKIDNMYEVRVSKQQIQGAPKEEEETFGAI